MWGEDKFELSTAFVSIMLSEKECGFLLNTYEKKLQTMGRETLT